MPNRKYSVNSEYRYGFNGQENSDEIVAGLTTAMYWEYNSRIGRRWNVDPVVKENESPYLCFNGNPILISDVNGDDGSGPKNVDPPKIKIPIQMIKDFYKEEMDKDINSSTFSWEKLNKDRENYINAVHALNKPNYSKPEPIQQSSQIIDEPNATVAIPKQITKQLEISSNKNTSGKFDIKDAENGLKVIYNSFGRDMAEIVEKMYRVETNHFKSSQYRNTGTGGMEAHGAPPYYGWNPSYFTEKPIGLYSIYENKGMSGQGGNAQVTNRPKQFIKMSSVTAAMLIKANYIKGHGGNYARWYSTNSNNQALYRKQLQTVKAKIVNGF